MKKAVHHETVRVEKKGKPQRGKRKCDEDQVDRDTATARATIAAATAFEFVECYIDIDADPTTESVPSRPKRKAAKKTLARFGPEDMMNDKKRRLQDIPKCIQK